MFNMNNMGEVIQAISIGIIVANFLLNTCRVLKAIELYKECLIILDNKTPVKDEVINILYQTIYFQTLEACCLINDCTSAIKYGRKLLVVYHKSGNKGMESQLSLKLAKLYQRQSKYFEAKALCEKALAINAEIGNRKVEASAYGNLGTVFESLGEYVKAKNYLEKALKITKALGDRDGEAISYSNLATVYQSLSEYDNAKKYLEKSLAIRKGIGDRKGESAICGNLGTVFHSLGEYVKAKYYLEKALAISQEFGDRNDEAAAYGNLGTVCQSLGENVKAKDYFEKALKINKAVGDSGEQASCYVNLGILVHSLGEHYRARDYMEKALLLKKEIGDKRGEASCYGNLGNVFLSLGEYLKSKECLQKALTIRKEIGDRNGEAADYGNLGAAFESVGEYDNAKEYLEKALAIRKETGDRKGEICDHGNLGSVFRSLGEYVKAKDYHEKALAISQEIGDRSGEATSYGNLGTDYLYLGENVKAMEYLENAITIKKEIGDKDEEARCYGNLGGAFLSLGKYEKAKNYLEKAIAITKETGNRKGESSCYENLGSLFSYIGDYVKAKEYHEKAIMISKEVFDNEGEAVAYGNLGNVFISLGDHFKANECLEKALAISTRIGNAEKQLESLCRLAWLKLVEGDIKEAFPFLLSSIRKCEELRIFLGDNDQFKIHFSERHVFPYWKLSEMFCVTRNPIEALYVTELGRARALVDLMSAQYSVENHISPDPQSWVGIGRFIKKESKCICLYISYSSQSITFWILKRSGLMNFRKIKINEDTVYRRQICKFTNLEDFFDDSFRHFGKLQNERCEDRSLNVNELKTTSSQEEILPSCRLVEEEEKKQDVIKPSLSLCYKMIIAPVDDLILEEPEIIIVPDRSLYKIPFAALPDNRGKYLSETIRIRIVPSLTTLKLIQDSPADYHCQTGALIVGDPDVGWVRYKGKKRNISRLPCAGNEAAMIGRLLGVEPLLGEQATKQAVLEKINSVSLIHFAAHGDARRGEIALSPVRPIKKIPVEKDYLLTMSDVSQAQLRAKLVVLSCCHSGQGQIGVEGVVGIARAFLASGARSVLVALWALEDSATEQLMNSFYEHLVRGESASESLHEAMKWMRANGYAHVKQWAPFMLIGDNVTFDFVKYT